MAKFSRNSVEAISQWLDEAVMKLASARYEVGVTAEIAPEAKVGIKQQLVGLIAAATAIRTELNRETLVVDGDELGDDIDTIF